jgi:hypothetical protein
MLKKILIIIIILLLFYKKEKMTSIDTDFLFFIYRVNKYSIIDYTKDINSNIKKYILSNKKYNEEDFAIPENNFFIDMLNYCGNNYIVKKTTLNKIKNTYYYSILILFLRPIMNRKDSIIFINKIIDNYKCNCKVKNIKDIIKSFNITNHPMSELYNIYTKKINNFDKTNINHIKILGINVFKDCIIIGNKVKKGLEKKSNFMLLANMFYILKLYYKHLLNNNKLCCSDNNMCNNIGTKFNPKLDFNLCNTILLNIMNSNNIFKKADKKIKERFLYTFTKFVNYNNTNTLKNIITENKNNNIDINFMNKMVENNLLLKSQIDMLKVI